MSGRMLEVEWRGEVGFDFEDCISFLITSPKLSSSRLIPKEAIDKELDAAMGTDWGIEVEVERFDLPADLTDICTEGRFAKCEWAWVEGYSDIVND